MFSKALGAIAILLINNSSAIRIKSDPICNSSGCTEYLHPKVKPGSEWPVNYEVPNFGMDRDIQTSLQNIKVAEGIVGSRWTDWGSENNKLRFKNWAAETKYNYDMKLDGDMIDSQANLAAAEKTLKHKYELA